MNRISGYKHKNSKINNKPVSFEKPDSIRVDFIGNPKMQDLGPKSGIILFMDEGELIREGLKLDR